MKRSGYPCGIIHPIPVWMTDLSRAVNVALEEMARDGNSRWIQVNSALGKAVLELAPYGPHFHFDQFCVNCVAGHATEIYCDLRHRCIAGDTNAARENCDCYRHKP